MPHVAAVREFGDVFPQVFGEDVGMCAGDGALEQAPMPSIVFV
jgi:hypothetical protein